MIVIQGRFFKFFNCCVFDLIFSQWYWGFIVFSWFTASDLTWNFLVFLEKEEIFGNFSRLDLRRTTFLIWKSPLIKIIDSFQSPLSRFQVSDTRLREPETYISSCLVKFAKIQGFEEKSCKTCSKFQKFPFSIFFGSSW